MNKSKKINEDFLKQLAPLIGGKWRYNAILTKNDSHRGFYLSNGEGLILNVCYSYGCALPQWSLMFANPSHKSNFVSFDTIGCSADKSLIAISADLKNRLLSRTSAAYEELEKRTLEEIQKQKNSELSRYVIDSLKRVLNLNPVYDHRFNEAYRIETGEGVRMATIRKWALDGDCFSMEIDDISSEKIIKIMQIIQE